MPYTVSDEALDAWNQTDLAERHALRERVRAALGLLAQVQHQLDELDLDLSDGQPPGD